MNFTTGCHKYPKISWLFFLSEKPQKLKEDSSLMKQTCLTKHNLEWQMCVDFVASIAQSKCTDSICRHSSNAAFSNKGCSIDFFSLTFKKEIDSCFFNNLHCTFRVKSFQFASFSVKTNFEQWAFTQKRRLDKYSPRKWTHQFSTKRKNNLLLIDSEIKWRFGKTKISLDAH